MIEILLLIFCISLLALSLITMVDGYVRNLIYQAVIIFLIALFNYENKSLVTMIIIVIETLLVKGVIVPAILFKNIKENEIVREVKTTTPQYLSILIMLIIIIFGFVISYWSKKHIEDIKSLQFGISISTMFAGLFLILLRKQLVTHIVGYMVLENGIFILSLTIVKDLPILVALAITLDIFMGILLAVILINHIKTEFNDKEGVDNLASLKD